MNFRKACIITLLVFSFPILSACSEKPLQKNVSQDTPPDSLQNSTTIEEIKTDISESIQKEAIPENKKDSIKKTIEKDHADIIVEPEAFEDFFEYGFVPVVANQDYEALKEIMSPELPVRESDMSRIFNEQTLEAFKKKTYRQSWNESEVSYMIDLVEPNVGEYQFYFIFHSSEKWHWRLEHVLAPG